MRLLLALLLFLAPLGAAMALEAASVGGQNSDKMVSQGVDVAGQRLKAIVQPLVDAMKARTDAVIACAKQNKFYNESTKTCN